MLNKKKILILMGLLLGIQTVEVPLNAKPRSPRTEFGVITMKQALSAAFIGTALVGVYKFGPLVYNFIEDNINDKIYEKIVNDLLIMVIPQKAIKLYFPKEYESTLKKKARLMSSKVRILQKLELIIRDNTLNLSDNHLQQLKNSLNRAKKIFHGVELIDTKIETMGDKIKDIKDSLLSNKTQPCLTFLNQIDVLYKKDSPSDVVGHNNEKAVPSYFQQFIENKIVESIILSSKPLDECTDQEKLKRTKTRERITRLINHRIGGVIEHLFEIIDTFFGIELKNK